MANGLAHRFAVLLCSLDSVLSVGRMQGVYCTLAMGEPSAAGANTKRMTSTVTLGTAKGMRRVTRGRGESYWQNYPGATPYVDHPMLNVGVGRLTGVPEARRNILIYVLGHGILIIVPRRAMPRLKSYWNAKANSLMTPDQHKATAVRYAEWQHDRDLNNKARWNAACIERARQWALDHPEEARARRVAARAARKTRRLLDPAYAEHHKEVRRKHKANYRSTPSGRRCIRAGHLKPKGWTIENYDSTLHEQSNCCAICREPFTATPRADHKHSTPPVPRGLLCNTCNLGLGAFKDSPERCEAAATYLRKWS